MFQRIHIEVWNERIAAQTRVQLRQSVGRSPMKAWKSRNMGGNANTANDTIASSAMLMMTKIANPRPGHQCPI